MKTTRTALAALTAAALAAPLGLALAGPAAADTQRSGTVPGGGTYQLSVDRDDRDDDGDDDDRRGRGGFEVTAELDDVAPGSRWLVVLRQDGKRFVRQTVTADSEGDLDVDRTRRDTAGSDRFAMTLTRLSDGVKVRASVTR
jgi:hypothetical protein